MPDGYYVGVPTPNLVYVGCPDRAEFDKIGAEPKDHGKDANGSHVITKSVNGPGSEPGRPVTVIFQHWVEMEPVDAMIARHRREREAKAASDSEQGRG